MKTVLLLLRKSKLKLALAIIASAVSGLGIAGLIALINTALGAPRNDLPTLLTPFVALCLAVFIGRTWSEILLVKLSQELIGALRGELSREILGSPLRRIEQQGSHRLLAALTEDVSRIAALLTRLPTFCVNVAVGIGCFAYLGWLSWPLMISAATVIGLAVAGFCFAQVKAQIALTGSRHASDDLYKHFIAITNGTKELKLHAKRRISFLSEWLDPTINHVRQNFVKGMTIYAFSESIALLVFFIFIGVLLFLPLSVTQNQVILTGFALTFLYLITPVEVIVNSAPDFGQFRVSLKTIGDLQLSLDEKRFQAAKSDLLLPLHSVELDGVTHTYYHDHDDSQFTLGPINMMLKPAEVIFITGGNGSGKTTLAKLLVGLYKPESGVIRVNNQITHPSDEESYLQLFSCVFADFFLFEELLGFENTLLEKKAQELLFSLKLEHKVKLNNGRFSTTALSQGQRKRLALLVAVLEDRPIYLFDEWAADQDPIFKRVFYTEIIPFLKAKNKIVIAITHDDQYFHLADRHIKLEFGQIIDEPISNSQMAFASTMV